MAPANAGRYWVTIGAVHMKCGRCRLLAACLLLLSCSLAAEPRFRLAVAGLTHDHAWRILEEVSQRADVELVGIAEKIPELRDRARGVVGASVRFYDDYRQMLDEARPQAVLSFGDNREHVEVVKACAARKIHVMMEKPLAPSYAEARVAYEAARRAGIKLMVNYWLAWTPAVFTAYERVKAGEVGRVWRMEVRFGHTGPVELGVSPHFAAWLNDEQRNGGGAIIDFGCYGANLLRWYFGKPASVSAVRHTFKPQTYKVDDDAVIVANYPDKVGVVEASWNWPLDMTEVHVFGDKARLVSNRDLVRLVRSNATVEVQPEPLPPERRGPITFFLDAIRNNRPIDGLVGAEFNLDVAEILEAAKISARTGRAVKLPLATGGTRRPVPGGGGR